MTTTSTTMGWPGSTEIVQHMLAQITGSGLRPKARQLTVKGMGSLPSVFGVTPFAAASIGAAGIAVADLLEQAGGRPRHVSVDRRLASKWFATSLRPQGWKPPPPWDPIAGDYQCADGWIRLHTNAPNHRQAALGVLGVEADKTSVTDAVACWTKDDLEAQVVATGGCAAAMRTIHEWQVSEQGQAVASERLIAWEAGEPTVERFAVDPDGSRPLAGLRVLDLTRVLAGPVATRFLALLGADVLRIDPPWWDEPGVVPEIMLGKRSAFLDLSQPDRRHLLVKLLEDADVIVHGYRPGALDGLGLDAWTRQQVRPGLIDVSLDAYGWTGPWQGRRGFDSLVQMSTGIAEAGMRELERDKPTPLPVQALDHGTGYLMAYAVINALADQQRSGRGAIARLSLARTAGLLTSYGLLGADTPVRPENETDLAPTFEHTEWGPARRLRPPVDIDGVTFVAERPAGPLGVDRAHW